MEILKASILAIFSLCLRTALAAGTCNSPTVEIPIKDVVLSNDATNRGIPITIGPENQTLVFQVGAYENNTYVYSVDKGFCTNFTESACITQRGGLWDPKGDEPSLTPKGAGASNDEGATPLPGNASWTDQDIQYSSSASISGFPIGVVNAPKGSGLEVLNQLGMGANSSTLQYLKAAELISSASYGFYWGLNGATSKTQMDGSIVFGGYDAAKTTGKNYTGKIDKSTGCLTGLVVEINDMILNARDGSNTSVTRDTPIKIIQACIFPNFPDLISLPSITWNSFLKITGGNATGKSEGITVNGELFNKGDTYNGDITFNIGGDLAITIPNDQFVLPEYTIGDDGQLNLDESVLNVGLDISDDADDNMPMLGREFLSSAYLFVDHENHEFTIWQANPTTETNIVSVNPDCSNPIPLSDGTMEAHHGLSKGAIAGAAIGAIAGVALLAAAVFLLLRRKKQKQANHVVDQTNYVKTGSAEPWVQEYNKPELAGRGSSVRRKELPAGERPRAELPTTNEVDRSKFQNEPVEIG